MPAINYSQGIALGARKVPFYVNTSQLFMDKNAPDTITSTGGELRQFISASRSFDVCEEFFLGRGRQHSH